jgi:apolipoprotein N-acyltransferase
MISWFARLAPAVAGAVAALGLAPWSFWQLSLVSLALAFFLAARASSPVNAACVGWAFGVGYFAVGLFWIVEPFFVDPLRHGWMAPFALLFLSAGLALFWGAAFWLSARIAPGFGLVPIWTLAEALRGVIFTGFPWAGFAQIWVGQGADQSLAWIGPHGLALLTLGSSWALYFAVVNRSVIAGFVAVIVPVSGVALSVAMPASTEGDTIVRLIQPNAPQHQKWDPEMIPVFWQRQLDFTAQPADGLPDLIVWPETSVPALLENAGPAFSLISEAAGDAVTVVGVQRFEGQRLFNSLATVTGDGRLGAIYDKHHLVPFGEYVPFGDWLARVGIYGFAATLGQGFSAGPGPAILDFGKAGRGLPLICYEAVFPRHARLDGDRPDFLIQITNDAWFGNISGPYQHLAQSRMRAIEQGLPLIRAANTGVSAIIDPQGRLRAMLPLGSAGYVDAPLPDAQEPTVYAKTGDFPAYLAALLLLGVAFVTQRRRTDAKPIDRASNRT